MSWMVETGCDGDNKGLRGLFDVSDLSRQVLLVSGVVSCKQVTAPVRFRGNGAGGRSIEDER